MNFREELSKIREEKKENAETKAEHLINMFICILKIKTAFKHDDKLAIFAASNKVIIKVVDGPDLYKEYYRDTDESDSVFEAVVQKLEGDGCKIHRHGCYRHYIFIDD